MSSRAAKLDMDLSALPAMSVPMTEERDEDTLALCREHCTRAGMLFEDASPKAILIGDVPTGELESVVRELRGMTEHASALLAAAATLARECGDGTPPEHN